MLHIQKQIWIIQGFDHKSNEAEYVNRLPEKDIVSFIPKKRGWRRKRKEEGELKEFHSRWLYSALCLEDIVPHCAGTKPPMSARCLEVEPVVKVQGSLAGGEQTSCARNLFRSWSKPGLRLVWDILISQTFISRVAEADQTLFRIKHVFCLPPCELVGDHVLPACCCCCCWLYVSFFAFPIVASWVRQLGRWHERVLFCSQPNKGSGDPLMANQTCLPCCSPWR